MSNIIDELINNISKNPPISDNRFDQEINSLGFEIPVAYLEFMKATNGGINDFYRGTYFELWPIEKLIKLNKESGADEFANEYFIIGTNGGGAAYAINKKTKDFVQFELIDLAIENYIIFLGKDFNEFIKSLLDNN